ncbi:MAG: hypothetical protein ABW157_10760 [Candidatus Thiodiazotropha sp. LLP2]
MKTCLTHARVVLPDDILNDVALIIEDGIISAIDPQSTAADEIIDLDGKLLMPGMIDLHCDALEKEVEPRPNVHLISPVLKRTSEMQLQVSPRSTMRCRLQMMSWVYVIMNLLLR